MFLEEVEIATDLIYYFITLDLQSIIIKAVCVNCLLMQICLSKFYYLDFFSLLSFVDFHIFNNVGRRLNMLVL